MVRLRVLMLEDSPDDAIFIQKTLERAEFILESKVVSTRDDFTRGLDTFEPQLILSDHQLPQFSSTEALAIAKQKLPFVPFILVTGTASEEFAASIILDGAADYVLKGNLKRLPTAIVQALERKQTEASLRESEELRKVGIQELQSAHHRLKFHSENTPLGYIELDDQFRVRYCSKRTEEIFGWTERELIEKKDIISALVCEEDWIRAYEIGNELLSGSTIRNSVQFKNITKYGEIIWCEWFNSVMKNEDGDIVAIMSLIHDTTERKTFEEMLKEYNERYQILSKATNDAIWDWDIEHDVEIWNHAIQTIFGYTEKEVTSTKAWWKAKIHPNDYDRVIAEINDAFTRKKANWSSNYQYLCADGSYKYVLDRGYIIYHEERPVRMIGAMQDVTEQTNSVNEIEKLSLVASKTSNSVMITDAEEKIEWVNHSFEALTGYTLQEIFGHRPGPILQGLESDPSVISRMSEKVKQQETFVEEIINYSKSGHKYWVRLDVSPVFDKDEKLTHFVSIQTDISAQKAFESQITNIARELSSLIENANVPIVGIDRNGYINEWNLISTDLSEYSKDEVLARKWTSFIEPTYHSRFKEILDKALAGEPTRNFELPFASKSGKEMIILLSVSPRRDISMNIFGAICMGQDITELIQYRMGLESIVKERTKDLQEALEKEKELVQLKSRFVSIASHEFRTPLSTISLVTGLLQKHRDKFSEDEFRIKLGSIDTQVLHMTHLLDDILLLGKAEAGKIQTNYSVISLKTFFTQIANEIEQNAGTHKINVYINSVRNEFPGDEKLLRNIMTNLLTNAIKFSSFIKTVTMTVSDTVDQLIIEVEDKGIGISEEDQKDIFVAFKRGSNAEAIQGTGLGLSIAKRAIELLHGDIKVKSRLGKGSIFTVALPIQEK